LEIVLKEITIGQIDAGQRLDKYLQKLLPEAERNFIYKMLRKKNIVLNSKKADGSEKIQAGDTVKIFFSDETFDKFSKNGNAARKKNAEISTNFAKKLDIIFEDDNIIVVNKPSGLLSQKAKPEDVSINEIICGYLSSSVESLSFKPGVCNRLDRNTSGIVVAGKTMYGLQAMSAAFHDRTVRKYYICVVRGCFDERKKLSGYIKKDEAKNKVTVISKDELDRLSEFDKEGFTEIDTEFIPVVSGKNASLVKVHLITGKTHQIRAHLKFMGFPIAGDVKYGNVQFNDYVKSHYRIKSQMLHAYELIVPDTAYKNALTIKTPVPNDFLQVLRGENLWRPGIQEVLEGLH
jgi:23S rRNA pseudouridine955/2504/2580 synthase